MLARVVVQGRSTWDDWIGFEVDSPRENFGGSGANVAVTLSDLGLDVELVSRVGADGIGMTYLNHLVTRGVGTKYVAATDPFTSLCTIEPGRSYSWRCGFIGLPQVDQQVMTEALKDARAYIIIDDLPPKGLIWRGPSYWLPQIWLHPDSRRSSGVLDALSARSWRAVLLNMKEARWLEELARQSLEALSRAFPSTIFIRTDEAQPTCVFEDGLVTVFAVQPVANPVVALGGGDALAAGFVFGDLGGYGVDAAVRLGQGLASAAVSQVGCQIAPKAAAKIVHEALLER